MMAITTNNSTSVKALNLDNRTCIIPSFVVRRLAAADMLRIVSPPCPEENERARI